MRRSSALLAEGRHLVDLDAMAGPVDHIGHSDLAAGCVFVPYHTD